MAALDGRIGCVNAQAILELVFGEDFNEKFDFAGNVQAKMAGSSNENGNADQVVNSEDNLGENNKEVIPDNQEYEGYSLNNYPNPFNDGTVIAAYIPGDHAPGELIVFDLVGNHLHRFRLKPGHNFIEIGSEDLGYGVYFYSLQINGYKVETKKLIHIK